MDTTYSNAARQQQDIHIYLESNPNPNSMKFVLNFMLMPEGLSLDFPDKEAATKAPLALELFERFSFVERVFFMSNFVTLTKQADVDWFEVKDGIKDYLTEFFNSGKPMVEAAAADALEAAADKKQAPQEDDPEVVKKIKGILDEYIRPAVEQDGGAIAFDSLSDDGIVKVLLQGSCSGCPSSTITLKAGIENLLKRMIPEVQSVEAVGV